VAKEKKEPTDEQDFREARDVGTGMHRGARVRTDPNELRLHEGEGSGETGDHVTTWNGRIAGKGEDRVWG